MPEPELVPVARGCPGKSRLVAQGLQPESPAQCAEKSNSARVCDLSSGSTDGACPIRFCPRSASLGGEGRGDGDSGRGIGQAFAFVEKSPSTWTKLGGKSKDRRTNITTGSILGGRSIPADVRLISCKDLFLIQTRGEQDFSRNQGKVAIPAEPVIAAAPGD